MKFRATGYTLIALASCLLSASPMHAQERKPWPCADQVAKAESVDHIVTVAPPISNDDLVQKKIAPDISDLHGTDLHSTVVVDVILDRGGNVVCARASGKANTLALRSVEAAKQWKFKPLVVNGKTIPVQRQVVFVFENKKVLSP